KMIERRRLRGAEVEAAKVAVAHVVGDDEDDVRARHQSASRGLVAPSQSRSAASVVSNASSSHGISSAANQRTSSDSASPTIALPLSLDPRYTISTMPGCGRV